MAMHAFGSAGLMPRSVASGGFLAEICTSKGVSKVDPALLSGKTSLPDSGHHQDCCTLCVASAPVLAGAGSAYCRRLLLAVPFLPAPSPSPLLLRGCRIRRAVLPWLDPPHSAAAAADKVAPA
jgi:hypothetical protein